jgi:hypothetical protein
MTASSEETPNIAALPPKPKKKSRREKISRNSSVAAALLFYCHSAPGKLQYFFLK